MKFLYADVTFLDPSIISTYDTGLAPLGYYYCNYITMLLQKIISIHSFKDVEGFNELAKFQLDDAYLFNLYFIRINIHGK